MNNTVEFFTNYKMELSEDVKSQIDCAVVQFFPYSQRCDFVKSAYDCIRRQKNIHYINILFCGFNPQSDFTLALFALLLLSFCWVLFIILATTIDKLFVPALKVIAFLFKLNEHLAGVTLVAFGGCSPDVLTTLLTKESSKNMISELLGNSLFVSIFISSLILILCPFEMQPYSTIRDVGFLLFSLLYIDYALRSSNSITTLESCIILAIYVIYLVVLAVDQIMLKKQVRKLEKRVSSAQTKRVSSATIADANLLEKMRAEAQLDIISTRVSRVSAASSRKTVNVIDTRKSHFQEVNDKNANLFSQLFESINPIKRAEFEEAGVLGKISLIIRSPINSILYTFIPIVDYELPRHGWSKLLNCIQIVTSPIMFTVVFMYSKQYFGIPLWIFTMIFSVPLATLCFHFTRTDIPPPYHLAFAIFACTGSATTIYSCASEVYEILYVIGVVTGSSSAFLGCTLLGWGMSVGDLMSNVFLAINGYPRMGYAACFGSPMFNNVFIVGGHFIIKSISRKKWTLPVTRGDMDENCFCFLVLGLVFTLMWMLLTNCQGRRSVGFFSIGLYIFFYVYTLLGETSFLHSLAADPDFFPIL